MMNSKIPVNKIILLTIIATLLIAPATSNPFEGGDGSSSNPYEVATCQQLQQIQDYSSNHFIQTDNIDCQGFEYSSYAFSGNYDGDFHEINNLQIQEPNKEYVGMFSDFDGTAEQIILIEPDILGGDQVGGIAGNADGGEVYQSLVIGGTIEMQEGIGNVGGAGGVTGYIGHVYESASSATIISDDDAGGVTGYSVEDDLQRSYFVGEIDTTSRSGGVSGTAYGSGAVDQIWSSLPAEGVEYGLLYAFLDDAVQNSYWDDELGPDNGIGGVDDSEEDAHPLTTSEMKGSEAETNMNQLDWTDTWRTTDTTEDYIFEDGYPTLQNLPQTYQLQMMEVDHFSGGDGSSSNPYQIQTCEQLELVDDHSNSNFILTQDIDCTNTDTWDSGNGFNPINSFSGTLDGQGYAIEGLYLDRDSFWQGMIQSLDDNGQIENLGIIDATIDGGTYTGILAGKIQGDVANVYTSGEVLNADNGGGIAGRVDDDGTCPDNVERLYSTASVSSTGYSAGIIGQSVPDCSYTLDNSWAAGQLTGDTLGGIIAYSVSTSITNSYWDEEATGTTNSAGGTGLTTSQMTGDTLNSDFEQDFTDTTNWEKVISDTTPDTAQGVPEEDGYPILTNLQPIPQVQGQNINLISPADFEITITTTNSPIYEQETIEVNYQIDEVSGNNGEQEIQLAFNTQDNIVDDELVQVSGGGTETGTLTHTVTDPADTYDIWVYTEDDQDTDTITVEEPEAEVTLQNPNEGDTFQYTDTFDYQFEIESNRDQISNIELTVEDNTNTVVQQETFGTQAADTTETYTLPEDIIHEHNGDFNYHITYDQDGESRQSSTKSFSIDLKTAEITLQNPENNAAFLENETWSFQFEIETFNEEIDNIMLRAFEDFMGTLQHEFADSISTETEWQDIFNNHYTGTSDVSGSVDTSQSSEDGASAKFSTTGNGGTSYGYVEWENVNLEQRDSISFDYQGNNLDSSWAAGEIRVDGNTEWTQTTGSSWSSTAVDVSSYSGTHTIRFGLEARGTGNNDREIWYDSIGLELGQQPDTIETYTVPENKQGLIIGDWDWRVKYDEDGEQKQSPENSYTVDFIVPQDPPQQETIYGIDEDSGWPTSDTAEFDMIFKSEGYYLSTVGIDESGGSLASSDIVVSTPDGETLYSETHDIGDGWDEYDLNMQDWNRFPEEGEHIQVKLPGNEWYVDPDSDKIPNEEILGVKSRDLPASGSGDAGIFLQTEPASGELNVVMEQPNQRVEVREGETFTMSGYVECLDSVCADADEEVEVWADPLETGEPHLITTIQQQMSEGDTVKFEKQVQDKSILKHALEMIKNWLEVIWR